MQSDEMIQFRNEFNSAMNESDAFSEISQSWTIKFIVMVLSRRKIRN